MKNRDYILNKIENLKRAIQSMEREQEISDSVSDKIYDELHDIYLFIDINL